jgi:hypothetical protein
MGEFVQGNAGKEGLLPDGVEWDSPNDQGVWLANLDDGPLRLEGDAENLG